MGYKTVLGGLLTAALSLCIAASTFAADNPQSRVPVLVELFTSEGCSSCPPADAMLATEGIPLLHVPRLAYEFVGALLHETKRAPSFVPPLTDRNFYTLHHESSLTPLSVSRFTDSKTSANDRPSAAATSLPVTWVRPRLRKAWKCACTAASTCS